MTNNDANNNKMARMIAALDRLVNYFIPAKINADRDARNRAHVFLISHILGPFIGSVVPIALYVLDPHPDFAVAILALSIGAFWVFPFALRAGVPYNPLALISIQNLIFCILWSCYFYGGVASPTVPWILTIPLLAFFYLGSSARLRLIAIGMFAVNVAVFSAFYTHGFPTRNDLPLAALQGLGIVSTIAASLYVAMMAIYYANVQASQAELESKMREHMTIAAELRTATAEAERAGAAKAEFLARMSHELRTPLNAVIGYSQILLEEAEDEGDDGSVVDLTKIHSAGQHLLKLVNEVLDLSKIEAGKMELDLREANVAELLDELVHATNPAAAANGNEIVLTIAADIGTRRCDPMKLQGMVRQLLDNAVKFTENGRIDLAARIEQGTANDTLVIDVIDTGIGVESSRIDQLFENFSVADDTSTSKYGGTGLGLALSQKLCTLMGGEIFVESELGKGSRFTVQMPVPALGLDVVASGPLAPRADAANLPPARTPVTANG